VTGAPVAGLLGALRRLVRGDESHRGETRAAALAARAAREEACRAIGRQGEGRGEGRGVAGALLAARDARQGTGR